jgi:NAD(P)H-hydrate epimerase
MTHLSRLQCRALDEIAARDFAMPTLLLMENAARSAAVLCGRLLRDRPGEVLILTGPGNNGGDGLALARFLQNAGRDVCIAWVCPDQTVAGDAAVNREIAGRMGISTEVASRELLARPVAMVVDAMFGTGLTRPLAGLPAEMAAALLHVRTHRPDLPVLALDIPSGLDADTGEPLGEAVRATHTITFAVPKVGFQNPSSQLFTGEIVVGDIGVPRAAIERAALGPQA